MEMLKLKAFVNMKLKMAMLIRKWKQNVKLKIENV